MAFRHLPLSLMPLDQKRKATMSFINYSCHAHIFENISSTQRISDSMQRRMQDFSQGWEPSDGLVLECY